MNPEPAPWQEPPPIPLPARAAEPAPARTPALKNPLLAAFLALFPGIGHIYNGLYLRGVLFFLVAASLIQVASEEEIMGFAVGFVWLFNVLDAYRQATLINYGLAQDLGLLDRPRRPGAFHEGLAAGILFFLIGLVALLERFFVIDLELVFGFWPVVLMALGAWLVWGAISDYKRDRKRDRDRESPASS
jgi:hypothetical protein